MIDSYLITLFFSVDYEDFSSFNNALINFYKFTLRIKNFIILLFNFENFFFFNNKGILFFSIINPLIKHLLIDIKFMTTHSKEFFSLLYEIYFFFNRIYFLKLLAMLTISIVFIGIKYMALVVVESYIEAKIEFEKETNLILTSVSETAKKEKKEIEKKRSSIMKKFQKIEI